MHIAIAGNIGAGKTTLTKMLAKRYGWTAHFEPVDNNPYLEDYYNDMTRWSFNLQIYFLNKRFRDVVEISQSKDTIILFGVPPFRRIVHLVASIHHAFHVLQFPLYPTQKFGRHEQSLTGGAQS